MKGDKNINIEDELKELNEYRKIGTVEEFRSLKKLDNKIIDIVNGNRPKEDWED